MKYYTVYSAYLILILYLPSLRRFEASLPAKLHSRHQKALMHRCQDVLTAALVLRRGTMSSHWFGGNLREPGPNCRGGGGEELSISFAEFPPRSTEQCGATHCHVQ